MNSSWFSSFGLFLVSLAMPACAGAQDFTPVLSGGWTISTSLKTGRVYIGPDLSQLGDQLRILKEPAVRKEIELIPEQQQRFELIVKTADAGPNRDELSRAQDADVYVGAWCEAIKMELENVLTQAQTQRLRQLAFRIEIGIVGLGPALTGGRLSDEVGIHENQHEHLKEFSARFISESMSELRQLQANSERRMILELPQRAKETAKSLLGPYFHQRFVTRVRMPDTGKSSSDTTSRTAIEKMYLVSENNPDVQAELGLTEDQKSAMRKVRQDSQREASAVLKGNRGKPQTDDLRAQFQGILNKPVEAFEEIFTPAQRERLKQLAFRIDIAESSYAEVLTRTQVLGESAGVVDVEDLRRRITEIFESTERDAIEIKKAVEVRLAYELSAEQRNKFLQALGPYFEYKPRLIMTRVRKPPEQRVP